MVEVWGFGVFRADVVDGIVVFGVAEVDLVWVDANDRAYFTIAID
jgi:hypothetical protein